MLLRTLILTFLVACSAPVIQSTPVPPDLAPLPHARHGHRAHFVGDSLYVFGGFATAAKGRGSQETWIQDLGSKEWRQGASLNESKSFFSSTVYKGDLIAIGGSIERYDLEEDRWELLLPAGSLPHSHFGTARIGQRLFVLGGYPLENSGAFFVDLETLEVTEAPPLPGFSPGDHFHLVAALNGRFHVVGGIDTGPFETLPEHWVLEGDEWRSAAEPPIWLWAKFLTWTVADEKIYAFSGAGRISLAPEAFGLCYDPAVDRWHEVEPSSELLVMPTLVPSEEHLFVIGGRTIEEDWSPSRLEVYDVARDTWSDPAAEVAESRVAD